MECDYDIFISAKKLDDKGHPTKDREVAHSLCMMCVAGLSLTDKLNIINYFKKYEIYY